MFILISPKAQKLVSVIFADLTSLSFGLSNDATKLENSEDFKVANANPPIETKRHGFKITIAMPALAEIMSY